MENELVAFVEADHEVIAAAKAVRAWCLQRVDPVFPSPLFASVVLEHPNVNMRPARMMDQRAIEDVEDNEETTGLEAMAAEGAEGGDKQARFINRNGDAAMTDGVSHMLTAYFFPPSTVCLLGLNEDTA